MRWFATTLAVLAAAAAGFLAGYTRSGTRTDSGSPIEHRSATMDSELATLRAQKEDLEQRLEQVTKEQERLAQENEILHKQRATEQILGQSGAALPALPPK